MELTPIHSITSIERQIVIANWTLLAARLFAGGADELHPSDLQSLEPTSSPLVEQLADIALRPLVAAGICQRHERYPHCWWTIRDKSKATAYLNSLSNT